MIPGTDWNMIYISKNILFHNPTKKIKLISINLNELKLPNAPPISAPLVGMFTLTIPQSEPLGLK